MQLWTVDGDQARLSLHAGQLEAWDSSRRFVFVLAGTQAGKTSFGPWWLWREVQRKGQGDYLAVTASFDLFKLKMLPELRIVFEHLLKIGRYWAGEKVIELVDPERGEFWAQRSSDPMWGRIILRSSQSSGGLEAATAQAAWLDECGQDGFTLEDWQAVLRRLSLSQGRVLGTTTLYNLGWMLNEIYEAWADGDTDVDVIQFPSIENPAFPLAEFERAKRKMQGWRFSMFYEGKYARPASLIYGCFEDRMLVKPFPIPPDWPQVVGVDFGGANTATVWMAEDPETEIWYAWRETLEGGKSSADHVATARAAMREGTEYTVVGGASSETQQRMDWGAAGLTVHEPPIGGVEPGIDRVMALIKEDRFRVFNTLKGLRDELGSYRRKMDNTGEVLEEIVDKRSYHRCDCLRYASALINVGTQVLVDFV